MQDFNAVLPTQSKKTWTGRSAIMHQMDEGHLTCLAVLPGSREGKEEP